MLYLKGRIVEIIAPEQIEDHKPRVLSHWRQLMLGNQETKADVDGYY